MQALLNILIGLCDFFCFLCSKREKLETRLKLEKNLMDDGRRRK